MQTTTDLQILFLSSCFDLSSLVRVFNPYFKLVQLHFTHVHTHIIHYEFVYLVLLDVVVYIDIVGKRCVSCSSRTGAHSKGKY